VTSTPLWQTILGDLRRRIALGEYEARFATDHELMEEYGVSRHTIRQAVRYLQDEGLIARQRGRGSVVQPTFVQPLGTMYSLFRSIEASGADQRSLVIFQGEEQHAVAARVLKLKEDAPMMLLDRVRLADGVPIAHDRAWLPLEVAAPLLNLDFSHTALYDELQQHCGCVPDGGIERIRPVLLTDVESKHLQVSAGAPAFEVDRRTTCDGRPLEWRTTIVSGERFSFKTEWDPSTPLVAAALTAG